MSDKRKRDPQVDPLARADIETRARAAVDRILAEKHGAWGGVDLQDEWLVGVVASAFRTLLAR